MNQSQHIHTLNLSFRGYASKIIFSCFPCYFGFAGYLKVFIVIRKHSKVIYFQYNINTHAAHIYRQ